MKVEIEITKKDLHSILCAAIRDYFREAKIQLEPNNIYPFRPKKCDEDINDNLYEIRNACDAIANLCNPIEELDTVEPNDASGVILFGDSDYDEE